MFPEQFVEDGQSKYDEQHKIDIKALHDAIKGRKIRPATSEEIEEMRSTYCSDTDQLRKLHPTLGWHQLYKILRYRKVGVPIEGTTKDEQSSSSKSVEAEELRDKLKKVEDEKRATEERTNVFIKKLQQENLELKEELRQLKGEHEETHSSLKKSEDVASRDAALERNLVLLAQGVLNLKISTEKKFKKLEKKVANSARDQKGAESQEELVRKLEEKDDEIEKLKNTVTGLEAQVIKCTEDGKEHHKATINLKWNLLQKACEHKKELDGEKFKHVCEIRKLKEKYEQSSQTEQSTKDEQSEEPELTEAQIEKLVRVFGICQSPSMVDREKLAVNIGLTPTQVDTWFQKRRCQWRREKMLKKKKDQSSQTDQPPKGQQSSTIETCRFHGPPLWHSLMDRSPFFCTYPCTTLCSQKTKDHPF